MFLGGAPLHTQGPERVQVAYTLRPLSVYKVPLGCAPRGGQGGIANVAEAGLSPASPLCARSFSSQRASQARTLYILLSAVAPGLRFAHSGLFQCVRCSTPSAFLSAMEAPSGAGVPRHNQAAMNSLETSRRMMPADTEHTECM